MFARSKSIIRAWVSAFLVNKPWLAVMYLPKYLMQLYKYRKINHHENVRLLDTYPCLLDGVSHTPFDPHYFYQSAWLARCLSKYPIETHIDIGSSINMLSVLSAYQETIFVDYRPLKADLTGLKCVAGSITKLPFPDASLRSMSSLHVLEHIGLGRYGEPLDPMGSLKACAEITRVMRSGGIFYLSLPVGRERTCFNAHRIYDPRTIVKMFNKFNLLGFSLVNDSAELLYSASLEEAADLEYGCGLFVFKRI